MPYHRAVTAAKKKGIVMPYHVRFKDREITDQAELEKIILHNKTATIALCRNDEPYVVTLTYGYDQETKTLYFHCGKKGLKIDFIKRQPAGLPDDSGRKWF